MRVALIGFGAINRTVAQHLSNGPFEIVAVAVRNHMTERPGLPSTAKLIVHPAELAATHPDVVAEAAGRESVAPWGHAALECGADFIVSSMSAFTDISVLDDLQATAERTGTQVHIQPGALGGIDALSSARRMGIDHVSHRMVKPPTAWLETPAEELCDLSSISEPTEFFSSSAAETARMFPKNANVAMTIALAGIGPARTEVTLVADPEATTNRHEIIATGPFGSLGFVLSNQPLPDNPKSSALAALNLVRAIQNGSSPIVI